MALKYLISSLVPRPATFLRFCVTENGAGLGTRLLNQVRLLESKTNSLYSFCHNFHLPIALDSLPVNLCNSLNSCMSYTVVCSVSLFAIFHTHTHAAVPPVEYWQVLAEQRRLALAETLHENEEVLMLLLWYHEFDQY